MISPSTDAEVAWLSSYFEGDLAALLCADRQDVNDRNIDHGVRSEQRANGVCICGG